LKKEKVQQPIEHGSQMSLLSFQPSGSATLYAHVYLHKTEITVLSMIHDTFFHNATACLPSQNGSSPDHSPLDWQTLVDDPISE